MSWPFGQRALTITAEQLLGDRTSQRAGGRSVVRRDTALRHSAVWACLRLRADLISTMPIDVYRTVGDVQVEVPTPPVLLMPGGPQCDALEWMYSTQVDLDSAGNTVGIITARDGNGLPARIELQPIDSVVVRMRDGVLSYQIAGKSYTPLDVWHEKQYTMSGVPVGLSPIAYAASSINGYLSAQSFAADWFDGGNVPKSHLKNKAKILKPGEASAMKRQFDAQVENGGTFVSGADWDYSMVAATAASSSFLEERAYGIADIARFLSVPSDMIDADRTKGSITYANVTQRNVQLLIMNLGPAVKRRQNSLSKLTAAPRFVKLNPDELYAMDIVTRYASYASAMGARWLAPSEVRARENLQPFTPEQIAEFAALNPPPPPALEPAPAPAPTGDDT